MWKGLKSLGFGKQKSNKCTVNPDDLNKYFLSANSNSSPSSIQLNECFFSSSSNRFKFEMATEEEILKCLSKIKSNAAGEDKINLKFVKLILPYIIGPLTHIINFSLTTRIFPQD